MAITIAARKPYSFTNTTTDITITIDAYYLENSGVTSATTIYDITKTSVNPNIAESLTINLSPFAHDFFDHVPESLIPTQITSPVSQQEVELKISGNIASINYFRGFDGWVDYTLNTLGVATQSTVKNLTRCSYQYISARLSSINTIVYTTDDGNTDTLTNGDYGNDVTSVFPVVPSGLTITNSNSITIEGKNISNTVVWTLNYDIVTPYDDTYTIGFINRYGVWEFIDMVGRKKKKLSISREDYVRYDLGQSQNYNTNASRELELNTGWVDDAFEEVVEDLLLSEYIILYTGDVSTSTKLVMDSKSINIDNQRSDKMINYSFDFKEAGQIIPIV
jgi:hypothetical protein